MFSSIKWLFFCRKQQQQRCPTLLGNQQLTATRPILAHVDYPRNTQPESRQQQSSVGQSRAAGTADLAGFHHVWPKQHTSSGHTRLPSTSSTEDVRTPAFLRVVLMQQYYQKTSVFISLSKEVAVEKFWPKNQRYKIFFIKIINNTSSIRKYASLRN